MRKYLIGLLCGVMLASALSVLAAELNVNLNPFVIMVDGEKRDIEAYNINGFTYLKLADIARATSNIIDVKFNEVAERIEINTAAIVTPEPTPIIVVTAAPKAAMQTPKPKIYTEEISVDKQISESGKVIVEYAEVDGVKYISAASAGVLARIENINITPNISKKDGLYFKDNISGKIIISHIPAKKIIGISYVDYFYFQNTILPIIRRGG